VKKVMDELHGHVELEPRESGACFVATLRVAELDSPPPISKKP
jgi:hypothetical protein